MLFNVDEKVVTSDEWTVLRKEVVMGYLNVLHRTSPVDTEEKHEKHQVV
jgi:hypothetical protein